MKTQSIIEYMNVFNGTNKDVLELTINHFNILGEIEEVDLMDLLNFPNLEKLTLINLTLDDQSILILTKLNNLKELSLINCEILIKNNYKELLKVKQLSVDNTYFEEYINNNTLDYLEIKNLSYNCENIKTNTLKIDKANIDLNTLDFNNINNIIISKKQFEEHKEFLFTNKLNTHLIIKDDKYDEVLEEYD